MIDRPVARKIGPNMKRLLAHVAANLAIHSGNGDAMQNALSTIVAPDGLRDVTVRALRIIDDMVNAIRASTDNPYGEDEEAIIGAILFEIDKRDRPTNT